MEHYRVSFYNNLTNSSGHQFHCCQRTIDIRLAKSKDRALEAAKRRFARKEAVPHWSVRAHLVEIEALADEANARRGDL